MRVYLSPEYVRDQITFNGVSFGWINSYHGQVQENALELSHPYAPHAFWYIHSGEVAVRFHSVWFGANAGQLILLPSGAREHAFSAGSSLTSIRFELNIPSALWSAYPWLQKPLIIQPKSINQSWMRLSETLAESDDLTSIQRFQSYLSWLDYWWDSIRKNGQHMDIQSPIHQLVGNAIRVINDVDLSRPFTESSLARKLSVSKNHLRKLFHDEGLGSPTKVYDERRKNEAILLLKGTKQTVHQIADDLGFASSSHFGAWFKKLHAMSPTEFRTTVNQSFSVPF